MLKIHGRATSSNVQPVVWLAAELGLNYERLDVGGAFGGTDTPEYRRMNPMGLVPVIEDGEVTLFESQAILRYLAARHGDDTIWPSDPVRRAPVDQWLEWAKTSVAPNVVYKIFWQLVRTTAVDRNHSMLDEGVAAAKKIMAIADARLGRHDYLVGDQLTLADFSFGANLYRYFTLEFDRDEMPNLRAYYDRLAERPAFAEHVMVSYEPLRVAGA